MNKMLRSITTSQGYEKKILYLIYHPILMHSCETWSTTQGDEDKLLTSERKFLRKSTKSTDLFKIQIENTIDKK